jgi:hypothetical protein
MSDAVQRPDRYESSDRVSASRIRETVLSSRVELRTMSTERTSSTVAAAAARWKGGVAAGVAGSLVMAALISLIDPPTLAVAIPALYGLGPPPNGVAGWIVHTSHGAIFGLVYAAVARAGVLGDPRGSVARSAGVGLAYGVPVWVGAAAILMPVWLSAVGFPNAPPLPDLAVSSLLWHAVFGLVLGAAFPRLCALLE